MAINLGSTGLRRSSRAGDDIDPMASVANLVDVMLVFACGLMLSLVVYWNIDLGPTVEEVVTEQQLTEVDDIEQLESNLNSGGSSYNELGVVYQDPTTGKLYMLTENTVGSSAEGAGTSGTPDAASVSASSTTGTEETTGRSAGSE